MLAQCVPPQSYLPKVDLPTRLGAPFGAGYCITVT
jgi:hypothetical protein